MDGYPRKEWLEDALLEYVGKNEGVDSLDIVSHFKLSCDITLMSLTHLVDSGKISKTQAYMKFEYSVNKSSLRVLDAEEGGDSQ